ncbi:MAG: 2-phospho-L-lactate transferase, partial [Candidatus Odinarchaeota archaeon]|nr:2-phospho-L-lactate transferase [Candidatus Odinarchaeota archaeon]
MTEDKKLVVLCGGVGAAKFMEGLVNVVPSENITAIVNTGDDDEFYDLYVSPDMDILIYTLAGVVNKKWGWGFENETFNCLSVLAKYGHETWFKLGDKDLATHIHRTYLLHRGHTLSEITDNIRKAWGVKVRIIPMTNSVVRTRLKTNIGELVFEEYFVKNRFQPEVKEVIFEGIEDAEPAPGVIESIENADGIIIAPSNPFVSINPILSVRGIKDAIKRVKAKKIAISPIVGGKAIKGPAALLLKSLGYEVSAKGVAKIYSDFLDIFIIDSIDENLK